MKNKIKYILQRLFGLQRYLFSFALYKVYTLQQTKSEKGFIHFIKMLPENAYVLDIGANIGYMSVILSKKFSKGKIFSFEPVKVNLLVLNRLLSFFRISNVTVFDCALGDKEGEIEMIMPVEESVRMHGLSHVVHDSIDVINDGDRYNVPIKLLDSFLLNHSFNNRLDGIKIDVENFEYYVLKGGIQLLSKFKPIIYCELWDNENRIKTFNLLKGLEYECKILSNDVLIDFDATNCEEQNFFFVPHALTI
jgi:FkbM family methyltransferase